MFKNSQAFSGFSTNNLETTEMFYKDVLGLNVTREAVGLTLHLATGADIFVYPKEDHTPASFTILNFPVDDIDKTVDDLKAKGITFETYDHTDQKDIFRGKQAGQGPDIAWFKDPAGNILSILQQ